MQPRIVAGCDAAYHGNRAAGAVRGHTGRGPAYREVAVGAVVVVDLSDGRVLAHATAPYDQPAAYVPGRFYEREGPIVEAAWLNLGGVARAAVDVLLCDGHGRLHPEGRGLAVRVGESLGVPTVGVAKAPLPPVEPVDGLAPGEATALSQDGVLLGYAWRPREAYHPLYVSGGHRVDAREALEVVIATTVGETRPRPLKAAHEAATRRLREFERN